MAVLVALFYLLTAMRIAAHRLLWFDELGSLMFARLPDAGTIWQTAGRLDAWGMPAPYYILVHYFNSWFGPPEVAARLPSAIAVVAGLLIVFDCARRLTDGLHGLIAFALLTCSFLPYYAFEARSYGLYFMLAALTLWVWTHVRATRPSAILFFILFFLIFMMHPYGLLCLVPFGVWDICFSKRWWLPSPKVLAGAAGIACAAGLLSLHLAEATAKRGKFPGPHPSTAALLGTFPEIFPGLFFLLALVMLWIALSGAGLKPASVPPMLSAERTGWLFLLMPIAGFILAELVTNAFGSRYFIGMLPGVAVAFACLLWRHFRASRRVALGVLCLFAFTGLARQTQVARHPGSVDTFGQQTKIRQLQKIEDTLRAEGREFLAFSGNFVYRGGQYYSKHPEAYRLIEPADPTFRTPAYFAQYYSLKTWTLDDVKAHARQTAAIFPDATLLAAMKQAGFTATTRFSGPVEVVYFQ